MKYLVSFLLAVTLLLNIGSTLAQENRSDESTPSSNLSAEATFPASAIQPANTAHPSSPDEAPLYYTYPEFTDIMTTTVTTPRGRRG